jgi:hypothetical protein
MSDPDGSPDAEGSTHTTRRALLVFRFVDPLVSLLERHPRIPERPELGYLPLVLGRELGAVGRTS